jgi:hypothetical protein
MLGAKPGDALLTKPTFPENDRRRGAADPFGDLGVRVPSVQQQDDSGSARSRRATALRADHGFQGISLVGAQLQRGGRRHAPFYHYIIN